MKIAIVDFTGVRKTPEMYKVRGCGASDRAILELVEQLPRFGHEVHFFTPSRFQGKHQGATWHNIAPSLNEPFECDVVIMQRLMVYQERFKYKQMIYYVHDDVDAPVNENVSSIVHKPDAVVCLSPYHKDKLISVGFSPEKIFVVPEGVDLPSRPYLNSRPNHCIYASAPFKGLPLLIKLWSRIKERVPDATLHVCSGMGLYQASEKDLYFKALYDAMAKDESIINHGVLRNDEVLDIMARSKLMIYPNIFAETFCAAAIESISRLTPVISSNLGALSTTIGDCGVLISGDPKTAMYQTAFVELAVKALRDEEFYTMLTNNCIKRKIDTWKQVAKKINDVITITMVKYKREELKKFFEKYEELNNDRKPREDELPEHLRIPPTEETKKYYTTGALAENEEY